MAEDQFKYEVFAFAIRWNKRGSCGQQGCKDPECCCSLCGEPIGLADDYPRLAKHDPHCYSCALCEDSIPLMLFRGEGKSSEQAQFHARCFKRICFAIPPRSGDAN